MINFHGIMLFSWALKKKLKERANFEIMEGFFRELLKENIKVLDATDGKLTNNNWNNKFNRTNFLVKNSTGQLINIEFQIITEYDYFYKILYNTAKAITEHMDKGMTYSEVKKIITVSVVYFDLGQGKDYVYHGKTIFHGMHTKDTLELSEKQKKVFNRPSVSAIYPDHFIIKVNEFGDVARDSLDEWIYFLKNSEIKDKFKAKGLDEAREKLKEINLSKEEYAAYLRYIEDLRYEASLAESARIDIEWAKDEAKQEGKAEGKLEGKLEVAIELKKQGLATDIISKSTGLTKEEIEKL